MQLFTNNAASTVAVAVTNTANNITVATGGGAKFPSPVSANGEYALLTLSNTTETQFEIVKLTSRGGDILAVDRAQEGTTAVAWPVGTKVELRLTAAAAQAAAAIGNQMLKGTAPWPAQTINMQCQLDHPEREVADGALGVAIGSSNKVHGTRGVAVGFGNRSSDAGWEADNILVGNFNTASGVSKANADSGAVWVANTNYFRDDVVSLVDGGGATVSLICRRSGTSGATAPNTGNALGLNNGFMMDGSVIWVVTKNPVASTVLLGSHNRDMGYQRGVSAGNGNLSGGFSFGNDNLALQGSMAIGVGSSARNFGCVAIGVGNSSAYSMVDGSIVNNTMPCFNATPDWMFGTEYKEYANLEGKLWSEPIDLAGGATWAANTAFKHGYACKVAGVAGQWIRWDNNFDPWDYPNLDDFTPSLTGATQPNFAAAGGFGGSVNDGNGSWIHMLLDGSYEMQLPWGYGSRNAHFLIDEIGFLVYDGSGDITVQPHISIGGKLPITANPMSAAANLTAVLNNVQTSGLNGSWSVWKATLNNPVVMDSITIKVDTLATGTRLLGRFWFRGHYVLEWV